MVPNFAPSASPIATKVALAGSGQDSERASLDNDVQQIHVLAKVWGKPLALAMGFLTTILSFCEAPNYRN